MKEEQKKIELLQKIAHRLNEAHVQWALGRIDAAVLQEDHTRVS